MPHLPPLTSAQTIELREPLLSQKTVATLLGISPRSLEAWRRPDSSDGPPFIRISKRCVRYRLSDVQAWLARRAQIQAD